MMQPIVISTQAAQDLHEHFFYIRRDNGETAWEFFYAVQQTFIQISRSSALGDRCPIHHPQLKEVYSWSVKGFRQHLVFYQERQGVVEIMRILYAA